MTAVVVIWLSSALMAIFAPEMITGSQQEHIPLVPLTVWIWATLATAYVLMTGRRTASIAFVVGVSAVWIAALIAVVATPPLVTGTDPRASRSALGSCRSLRRRRQGCWQCMRPRSLT